MRWLLVDEFTEIRLGEVARGFRCVSRADGALSDFYPAYPVMPPSLMLEMMAQVGGVLVGATLSFKKEVVLAKISDAVFNHRVIPPTTLEIEGRLSEIGEDAALTDCRILDKDKEIARAHVFFGLFDTLDPSRSEPIVFSRDFMQTYAIQNAIIAPASDLSPKSKAA